MRALAWLGRHATEALVAGVLIGLALPHLAAVLQGWLSPLVFVFTAAAFLKSDIRLVALAIWRRPLLPALLLIWLLVAIPLATAGMIHWLHVPLQLGQALMVWAASPSMTAAIVFASLLGLDVSLATSISTISMIVVPLTGPFLINWLAGVAADMDVLTMMGRTAAFIGGALAVAWVARRLSGPATLEKRANELNGAIIILLVLFGMSLMGGVSDRLISDPGRIIEYVAAAFVANLVAQIMSSILFAWDGSWRSATAALLSGNRNMSVLCANLGGATTPDIMLFFAASHVPIYLLPWILRKAYDWAARSCSAGPQRGLLRS